MQPNQDQNSGAGAPIPIEPQVSAGFANQAQIIYPTNGTASPAPVAQPLPQQVIVDPTLNVNPIVQPQPPQPVVQPQQTPIQPAAPTPPVVQPQPIQAAPIVPPTVVQPVFTPQQPAQPIPQVDTSQLFQAQPTPGYAQPLAPNPYAAQQPMPDYNAAVPAKRVFGKVIMVVAIVAVTVLILFGALFAFVMSKTSGVRTASSGIMSALATGNQTKFDSYLSPDLKKLLDGSPGIEQALLDYTKKDFASGYSSSSVFTLMVNSKETGSSVYEIKDSDKPYFGLILMKINGEWKLEYVGDQAYKISAEQFLKDNSSLDNSTESSQ